MIHLLFLKENDPRRLEHENNCAAATICGYLFATEYIEDEEEDILNAQDTLIDIIIESRWN